MFNIQCAFIFREQRAFFEQKVWIYRRNERLALPLITWGSQARCDLRKRTPHCVLLLANHALIIGKPSLFYQLTISQLRTSNSPFINGLLVRRRRIISPWASD